LGRPPAQSKAHPLGDLRGLRGGNVLAFPLDCYVYSIMYSLIKGDVKQLTNFTPEYRLRIGDYRVLFEIEEETIIIYRIRHRREAYR